MDCGIGNRLPVSDHSAETAIQRQGRHFQWRRSADEYSRYVQSLVSEGQLFWRHRHRRSRPINFIDLHPHVETAFQHGVTASFDWIFQWRESLQDGVYSVPGFLIIPAGKSNARFVGHRPGMEVRWQANRHLWFQADYGIFYAGKFVKESQPGRNLNYWALWTGYKF